MEALRLREDIENFDDTSEEYDEMGDFESDELLTLDDIFGTDTEDEDTEDAAPIDDFHAYFDDDSGDTIREDDEEETVDLSRIGTDDSLSLYLQEMGQVPLLSREEEIDLAQTIEAGREAQHKLATGDHAAAEIGDLERQIQQAQDSRRHLIEANTRLVVSVAKRYRGYGLPFLDLIQAGNVGLIKAVDKFDYHRGNRFSTYATWWIRQAVTRSLTQHGRGIRIPIHMSDYLRKLDKISRSMEQRLGRRPTYEELAAEANEEPQKLRRMLRQSQRPVSLNKEVGDEDTSELEQFIEDENTPQPDETAEERMLHDQLEQLLTTLEPREAWILKMRFGLHGSRTHTLKELGQKLGISKERVRQIQGQALRKLRHPYHRRQLQDFR
jgi:RNA polymerase primary sigma factor